jgi:hypothetical protein
MVETAKTSMRIVTQGVDNWAADPDTRDDTTIVLTGRVSRGPMVFSFFHVRSPRQPLAFNGNVSPGGVHLEPECFVRSHPFCRQPGRIWSNFEHSCSRSNPRGDLFSYGPRSGGPDHEKALILCFVDRSLEALSCGCRRDHQKAVLTDPPGFARTKVAAVGRERSDGGERQFGPGFCIRGQRLDQRFRRLTVFFADSFVVFPRLPCSEASRASRPTFVAKRLRARPWSAIFVCFFSATARQPSILEMYRPPSCKEPHAPLSEWCSLRC